MIKDECLLKPWLSSPKKVSFRMSVYFVDSVQLRKLLSWMLMNLAVDMLTASLHKSLHIKKYFIEKYNLFNWFMSFFFFFLLKTLLIHSLFQLVIFKREVNCLVFSTALLACETWPFCYHMHTLSLNRMN